MDHEIDKILSAAENQRRQQQKREDRAVKLRAYAPMVELIKYTRSELPQIARAIDDNAELFARAERLGLRQFCLDWMEDFERNKGKLFSIRSALEWIENLTDRDFRNYSPEYDWESLAHSFIVEFMNDKGGDARGVARDIKQKAALLQDWIRRNANTLGVKPPPVTPAPRGEPTHRVLNNLTEND
jgi:hypothetical protein